MAKGKTLMKVIRVAQIENEDWQIEMSKFLTAYRSIPQETMEATPFYHMFRREMRSKLPDLRHKKTVVDEDIYERLVEKACWKRLCRCKEVCF